jgi:hypothetical protein
MKGLLDMTRRERRGTIVLLAAIALMLVVAFAARCHHEVVPEAVNDAEISRFETQVDSVQAEPLKPSYPSDTMKSTKTTKKRSRRAAAKKPKPTREPRPVDPVPSF